MTPADFTHWLMRAEPGERMIYHTGDLVYDRERDQVLNRLAKRVYVAYEGGFIELTRFRVAARNYAYLATRTQEIFA